MKIILLVYLAGITLAFSDVKEAPKPSLDLQNLIEHFTNDHNSFYLLELKLPIEIDNVAIARSKIVKKLSIIGMSESFVIDLKKSEASGLLILAPDPIKMMIENRGRCITISLMQNEFVYVTPGVVANGMIVHGEGGITLKLPDFAKFVREQLIRRESVKD
jgi:hypothetical protein